MSSFESNLLAEGIGLIVGLLLTYVIVERVISHREQVRWRHPRRIVGDRLKRATHAVISSWLSVDDRQYWLHNVPTQEADFEAAANRLRQELGEQRLGDTWLPRDRDDEYWAALRHIDLHSALISDCLNRDFVHSDDPGLAALLIQLEDALSSLDRTNRLFGHDPSESIPKVAMLQVLSLYLQLFDWLHVAGVGKRRR